MAAHIVLLLLLFSEGERNCISVADGFSKEFSERQQVLAQPESTEKLFMRIRDVGKERQGDVRALPNVKLNAITLEHTESAATSSILKHSPELPVNHEKKTNLTNGEVEGVINDGSPMPNSEEEQSRRPELHLETGVSDILPSRMQGLSKWVMESEDGRSGPQSRRRRSWLWNQFFVIEEYRGPEPVLIGRVSSQHECVRGQVCASVWRTLTAVCILNPWI